MSNFYVFIILPFKMFIKKKRKLFLTELVLVRCQSQHSLVDKDTNLNPSDPPCNCNGWTKKVHEVLLKLLNNMNADGIGRGRSSYWYGQCTLPSSHPWNSGSSGDYRRIYLYSTLLDRLLSSLTLFSNSSLPTETNRHTEWSINALQ